MPPRTSRKQLFSKVFTLFLCLQLYGYYVTQAQVSGTYTINSTLPTGGTNFNSFTAAVAYLQTGLSGPVVFNVAAGTGPYNEQVYLNNTIGTSSTNTLTFNCNGVTLSFTSTNTNSRAGVKLENISYVTFDNLRITPQAGATAYGYGFHLLNNADNNVIQNCQIVLPFNATTPANNEGIVINGNHGFSTTAGNSNCDNNTIRNNTISGGNAGITLSSVPVSGSAVLMQGNKILNNTISDSYISCIQLYYNDGTIVDGNDLQGGPHATTKVMGVYLNLFDQNVQVINNKIHNFHISNTIVGSYIYGILNSAQGAAGNVNLFASNLIYDFSSNGIQHGISSRFAAASYFNIYHNTISIDDQVIYGQESDGIYFENVSDVNVLNNIITISRRTSDWNYGIALVKTMTRLTSNRNVFNVKGADFSNAVGSLASRRLDSLPLWQQVTGLDYSSVYEDPLYTNLAAFNFVPTAQPIDNMGLVVNVNTDIIGATRSSLNPDPGCYEFVTPACQTPVKPGITRVLPDSVMCYGPTIALGLKGNSWGVGQTYTWQSASSPTGTYSDISSGLAYPAFDILPATTTYYRAAVTCMGNTMYSAPIRVIIHTKLPGGTYTINSTQPTGGINFTSFSDAALAMQCGVTGPVVFNVAPNTGPYNEQLSLPSINNTPAQTVVFKGNGDTLAFSATNNDDRAVIKLNGIDYVTIDSLNLVVTGASYGYGVQLIGDADFNTIKKCSITLPSNVTTSGFAGIVINNSRNNAIDITTVALCDSNSFINNTITGGYYGITCTSRANAAPAVIPEGNAFIGNRIMDICGSGIYLDGVAKSIVDSNDISQPTRSVFTNFNGIYIKQSWPTGVSPHGMQITRNKVHDLIFGGTVATVEAHGIHFETVTGMAAYPSNIHNNAMYNFWGVGRQYGLYSRSSNHLKVYHNTISLDDSTGTTNSGIITCGYGLLGNATVGTEFKNNCITIRRGGLTTRTGIIVTANDLALKADYNNYLISGSTGLNYTGSQAGTSYAQLSDWLAVRKDTNSVSIDPGYINVPGGDLTPGYVPFENKGTALNVPRDINDSTRNITKPDLGAYEFTICYPLGPLVVTIDSVGSNTVRYAWKPVANATSYLVSRNGLNWLTPSSGKLGTTHIVTGLSGLDTTGLIVKALGTRYDCPPQVSPRIKSQTLTDEVFFPNMFSPNGNHVDDEFKLYSNVVKSMRLMIYNQWGVKVFETSDYTAGWDGNYKGKPQPVGVYIYVASVQLTDGTSIMKKGSVNLIR